MGIPAGKFQSLRGRVLSLTKGSNRKIVLGILANAIDKVWVTLFQLASLGILPKQWGAAQFGIWLIVTTVPTYLALGGLGFGNAAGTDMTAKVAKGDYDGALEDYQSVWLFVSLATAVPGLAILAGWYLVKCVFMHAGGSLNNEEAASVILVFYSLMAIQTGLTHTGFRSTGNYALGVILMDMISAIERFAVIIVALMGKNFVTAAAVMLVIRCIGQTAFHLYLQYRQPWFKLGFRHANRATLRRLLKPALASLGLAASNAFSLQGIITSIGIFLSPTSAALYSSTRTICRLPLQFSDLLSRATLPELTVAYFNNNMRRFLTLTVLNTCVAIASVLPFIVFVGFFGKFIGNFISRGGLNYTDSRLFVALAVAALFQAIWSACGQSLQAINKHHFFSFPYFCLAIVTLFSPLLKIGDEPILWVAIASALAEGVTATITVIYTYLQVKAARPIAPAAAASALEK
jgi:O-antigen/teichoic acid export membrane protein